MREIKFRCWNEHGKCFHKMSELGGKLHLFSNKNPSYVVEQFTGLLDINGAEIFEGDVVSCDAFICNLEVYYAEELAMFRFGVDQDDCGDFIEYQSHDFKVIGNIHENQEFMDR